MTRSIVPAETEGTPGSVPRWRDRWARNLIHRQLERLEWGAITLVDTDEGTTRRR